MSRVNVPGFPASAYALEAAVPAMSTDAYPGKQMEDNPRLEKRLYRGPPPQGEVGTWIRIEGDPALEEAIRAFRVQQTMEKLLQNELERQALKQDFIDQANAPSAGDHSGL